MATAIGKQELGCDYLVVVRLPDGTVVNEVTRWTGPGLGCDTEIECERRLTDDEVTAVLDTTAGVDLRGLPAVQPSRFQVVMRL